MPANFRQNFAPGTKEIKNKINGFPALKQVTIKWEQRRETRHYLDGIALKAPANK